MEQHCRDCAIRHENFFCSHAASRLSTLNRDRVSHRYRGGQVIFYEGTPPLAIHCISDGLVKLYKVGANDRQVTIRLLHAGEFMGYRAVLADEVYAATAEAVEDTTVCTITRDAVLRMVRDDHDLALAMMARLAKELRVSEDEMVLRLCESVTQRTARFLLSLARDDAGPPARAKVTLAMRREEFAHMIGTSPETLSRVLGEMSRRGILSLQRGEIKIRSVQSLRKLAQRGNT